MFPEAEPRGTSIVEKQTKIKRTTHECNTLQFNEEPKIANTQRQKSTVFQEVKQFKKSERNE